MKKIMAFSIKEDNSKIHQELHKKRIGVGSRVVKVASTRFKNNRVEVILKPKCLK